MTHVTKNWRVTIPLAAATLLASTTAGCESDRSAMKDFFPQDARTPHVFAAAHANAGARDDAALHSIHFDGGELNSLGREKLDAITADAAPNEKVVIYMNFAEPGGPQSRRDQVVAHLKDSGIAEANIDLVAGLNPDTTSPAAGHLSRMKRTESEGGASNGTGKGFAPPGMTTSSDR